MKKSILFLLLLVTFTGISAQNLDNLTLEQRKLLQQQLESQQLPSSVQGNMSSKQKKTTNSQQISAFREYINAMNSNLGDDQNPYYVDDRLFEGDSLYREFIKEKEEKELKVFGSEIFNNSKISFEPNLYLPTPANYIIGTNDELLVDVSGLYDVSYKAIVSPEGRIRIPNAGLLKVGGMTFESATNSIKRELSKYYSGINTGETKVNVSLGNIRSIKVSIAGEAAFPGTYTLPSLATVINALYACGGPGKIGSMRDVKVVRNEKTVAELDFYQFLMTGKLNNNIVLQDNDVIIIEPNTNKVIVDGAINRRGIYEVKQGESLYDMLNYAGGFREDANRSMISVFRYSGTRRTVVDIPATYAATSLVKSGDSIYIAKIENVFDNRVELSGAVYRPGGYELTADLSVKTLIEKAGGVLDDAFINMATIKRQRKNDLPEMISFNLGKVLKGENKDVVLMKGDSVQVDFISDFMEEQVVSIEGEVVDPGRFPLTMKMSVRDLIFKAKGFTEKASTDNVELIRIIKDPSKMEGGNKKSVINNFKFDKDLNFDEDSGDIELENGDLVIVRPIEGIEPIRIVSIDGEVKNPGFYNIEHKNIKVSDLVKMSGGFTKYAFVGGAYLLRNENRDLNENSMSNILSRNLKRIMQSTSSNNFDMSMLNKMQVNSIEELNALDTISGLSNVKEIQDLLQSQGVVSLDLNEIIKQPGSYKDIFIEDGDILFVPKKSQTVKVIGEVMYPSFVVHTNSYGFRDYITSSGGFSNRALKKNSFVLRPNGKVIGTKSFLGIKIYPKVVAGSIIVVPKKPVELTNKMNTAEIVTMSSSLTSMLALIYSMISK